MEGLWSKEENIAAAFQALRAADAAAPPASRQEVAEMMKWLRTATGGPGSAKLQRRVLEMLRLQDEVGLKPPLRVPFIQAGGVTALLGIIVTWWPEGSNFAESQHDSDTVVLLPVELDLELIACGPCSGQRHLGINGQGQPLHRSLRRAALAALAEMSNYSPIIEAIVRDGRLFDASWLPRRLQQLLSQYKYELNYGQVAAQRDQVHAIALRMLYLCANCSPQLPVALMLNAHCSVQVIQCFRDEWQRQHEPLNADHSGSSSGGGGGGSSSSASAQPNLSQRRRLHKIPARWRLSAQMNEMAIQTAATQAVSDMMSYTVVRVLTHCVHVATPQQKLAWIEAGAIAKARCVQQALQHASATMRAGGGMDTLLQHLLPVWHEHARAEALKHSREVTAVAKAEAEQGRLLGNAAYKAGQLQEALNFYRAAAQAHPSDHLLYNNISLVQLKLGHVTEAYAAALAALGHCPGNAKAWLRAGEACKAAGRWQLAQLFYSMAVEELGVTDEAAKQSLLESRGHLSRVWQWADVPAPWDMDALAAWLGLPAMPKAKADTAAWRKQLYDEWFRLSTFNSRAMAAGRKVAVLAAQAWRAAEAGRLRQLPESAHAWRLSWQQLDIRMSSGVAMYEVRLFRDSTPWVLTIPMEGEPCTADLLTTTALQCWFPNYNGARQKPKELLLAFRCKHLFAELQDTITARWGVPLRLETELEALRAAKEQRGHHMGLQESYRARISSGASELDAMQGFGQEWNRIQLEEGEQDEGCDHKGAGSSSSGGSNGTSSAQQPRADAGSHSSSSGNYEVANGYAAWQRQTQQQQQPPELPSAAAAGSSSVIRSSAGGPGWPALLAAVRAGSPTALEMAELTSRVQRL